MPKKISRKSQIKKNRAIILKAAKELFFKRGFYNTTMEEIARYSGLDRRTLYNHFKNKEDILASLISEIITRIGEIYNDIDLSGIPPIKKLKTLALQLLDVYMENSELLNIFKRGANKKQEMAISVFMMENIITYKEIEARLVQIIKDAQDEGVVIDIHPYILAGLFNEMILRSVFVWHNYNKDLTKDDIINNIIKVMEEGFIKKPTSSDK